MIYDLYHAEKKEGSEFCKSFILWPKQWSQFSWRKTISWNSVPAKKENVKNLPDKPGVYAFVVSHTVGKFPSNGIIAYVGETKASAQSLKKRCAIYFRDSEYKKRPHIGELLHLWPDNLTLYYTVTSKSDATKLEEHLLECLLPPFNRKFPGKLNAIARNIYHS